MIKGGIAATARVWKEILRRFSLNVRARTEHRWERLKLRLLARFSGVVSLFVTDRPFSPEPTYYRWILKHYPGRKALEVMRRETLTLKYRPLISLIVPVYNSNERFLRECIGSVQAQAYDNWELCLVDDGSSSAVPRQILEQFAATDRRIKTAFLPENRGIARASNHAVAMSSGEFIALLDHDDQIPPHALFEVVRKLNAHPDADLVYSDEDKLDEDGHLNAPFFKPDWCPESFLSRMYICHLCVLRRRIFDELGGFNAEFEGGHLYDLVLRLSERSDRIQHIPKVLYHWRLHANSTALDWTTKPYVYDADYRALCAAIERRGEPGRIEKVEGHTGFYRVRYEVRSPKQVDIIIPTRDQGELLERCLSSVFDKTTYPHFNVVLVDNGTNEAKALEVIKYWSAKEPSRFHSYVLDEPFNFPNLCNFGVDQSQGEYLLFLNNDTEVITPDWIGAMVEQAQRPAIGAVGALLFYPDGTIQHAGAIVGLGGVAAHSHRGCPGESPGYVGQVVSMNNYLSVAATCLMCRRPVFEEVGRFDPVLPGDYEDLDLCLKMIERGYRNVYLPHVQLYHYEQATRGRHYAMRQPVQQYQSVAYIVEKWGKYIAHDPCYNPNLTRTYEDYRIA